MAFLDTSVLISGSWNAGHNGKAVKGVLATYSEKRKSTLVLREFHQKVTHNLIIIHSLIVAGYSVEDILTEISRVPQLKGTALQLWAELQFRFGQSLDEMAHQISSLLEGELLEQVAAIASATSNLTKCEAYSRRIEKLNTGIYVHDVGCEKRKCGCASPDLLKRRVTPQILEAMAQSENADITEMVPILQKMYAGDIKAVQGIKCTKVADLIHLLEAEEIGSEVLLTTDYAFEELSRIFGAKVFVIRIPITALKPQEPSLSPRGPHANSSPQRLPCPQHPIPGRDQ